MSIFKSSAAGPADIPLTAKKADGSDGASISLDGAMFGVQPNVPVMHQVVQAQLAHRRAGTQSTLTRAEVRGGGAKPFKQKGTGRGRQGTTRAPHWVGGGIALGPKPRSYSQKTPKKMIRLALRSALSDRQNDGKVIVLDAFAATAPSTKAGVALLAGLGVAELRKVLVVIGEHDEIMAKSLRNLPNVQLILATELNAYDVLCSDVVVFTPATLPTATAVTRGDGAAIETTNEKADA